MKKIVLPLIAVISMSSFGFAASAAATEPTVTEESSEDKDEGLYLGLSYTRPSYDIDYLNGRTITEMDFNALSLQVGYKFNPYISVEGRYTMTFGDPGIEGLEPIDVDMTIWGIYVKPTYPLGPEFDIYALLGYAGTNTSGHFDIGGTSTPFSVDESSFSWGFGGRYILTEEFSVYADYLMYHDESSLLFDHVVDSINFGIAYQF